jgi:hypothetical protein
MPVVHIGDYAETKPNLLLSESQFKMRLYDEDLLVIENDGSLSFDLWAGSDLNLIGDDSDAATLTFIGGSYASQLFCDSDGYDMMFVPSVSETIDLYLGASDKIFDNIKMYAGTYRIENSTGFIGLDGANLTPAPTGSFNLGSDSLLFNNFHLSGFVNQDNVMRQYSGSTSMTDDTFVSLFNVDLNAGESVSGFVITHSKCTDGTDFQAYQRNFDFSAVNKSGALTISSDESAMFSSARSSDSLVVNCQAVANGTSVDFEIKVGTGLSGSLTLTTFWTVFLYSDNNTVTIY